MLRLILLIPVLAFAACAPVPPPYAPPPPPHAAPPHTPPAGYDRSPIGGMCGGMTGRACADRAAYCQYPETARCGAADQTGTCVIPPDMCTMEYRPVCGCDGQTYSNACQAAANRASVAYQGECRPK